MSIEMKNPETKLEKLDAVSNLLAQMSIALMIKDYEHVNKCLSRATELVDELVDSENY